MDAIIHAPEFPKGFAWLNTDRPLAFGGGAGGGGELKGQVVLLDFWTYCCINCMHVLPDLEYLEEKFKDQPVAIIGVHSAKYDNETDAANIRAAVQRYQVHHPVIVDERHKIWDEYAVNSWPTLVLVGSDGRIYGAISGEGHRELLEKAIDRLLADGRKNGTLAKGPLVLAKEGAVRSASGLSFPGKVLADVAGKRLVIVDSDHNRVVVTTYPGEDGRVMVQEVIGSGKAGAEDGGFAAASFHRPQGAALAGGGGNVLWVADTENHLIRRVDLERKTVTTVLGTGKQTFDPEAGKSGRQQGLNSPWDVAVSGNRLYIAQAGQHQIFAMNIMSGMTEVVAGTAREDIHDGAALSANLAQPSGMALDAAHQILYFADSEVSALRGLDIAKKKVFTVIGHGLFTFGDVDGGAEAARFQHALGVAATPDGSAVFLADTYNHKIKRVDVATRVAKTIAGDGKAGAAKDGKVEFFEPASVALGGPHELFVADTNNHRIVRLDPGSPGGGTWKELMIDGLNAPGSAEAAVDKDAKDAGALALAAEGPIELRMEPALPAHHHLTPGAPISVKVTDGERTLYTTTLSESSGLRAEIPASAVAGRPSQLYVMVYYTHCGEGLSAVCAPAKAAWKFAVTFEGSGEGAKVITLKQ